jgi:DNA-binding MarR family transcriptional regulator
LLDNEGATFRDIYGRTETNPNAVKKAIDELIELGLIYDKREGGFPRRRLIFLTDHGKEVARRLKEIEDIIKESTKYPHELSVSV